MGHLHSPIDASNRWAALGEEMVEQDNSEDLGADSDLMETEEIRRRHRGLGHVWSEGLYQTLIREGHKVTRRHVSDAIKDCPICVVDNAQMKKIPRKSQESKEKGTFLGDRVEQDLTFLPVPGALTRTKILSVMVDRHTGTKSYLPIPQKSKAYQHPKIWKEKYGDIKHLHTDNGGEFLSEQYKSETDRLGAVHIRGPAYTPQTQGTVERGNQEVKKILRRFLHEH